jgi:periplasmic divalent cation tolerance protein
MLSPEVLLPVLRCTKKTDHCHLNCWIIPMEQARIVLTTVSSKEEAHRIATALVEERLAACVNIVDGVRSVYRWQGAVESAAEIQLVIKTGVSKLEALQTALQRLHSYEVPEFLVLEVESGSKAYLLWLYESLE